MKGNRKDRQHERETLVLGAALWVEDGKSYRGGMIDISVSGVRVRIDGDLPLGTPVEVHISAIKFSAKGTVVRNLGGATANDIAVKFDEVQQQVPGRLLEYKLRSTGTGIIRSS